MSRQHHRHRRLKLRSFYVWHRYMGISAAAFVLLISITGLLLNHTGDLRFDRRHVQSAWMLDWYGIEAPASLVSYPAGDSQVTLMQDRLYLDRTGIDGDYRVLRGAAFLDGVFVIAADNGILLVTPRGETIEYLQEEDAVPAGMRAIGVTADGRLVARTDGGLYQADEEFISWTLWDGNPAQVEWARPIPIDTQLKDALQRQFRNQVLPQERVLLDLHSGRFFGRWGPWVFDAAALLLILLSLSGTLIWLKRRR